MNWVKKEDTYFPITQRNPSCKKTRRPVFFSLSQQSKEGKIKRKWVSEWVMQQPLSISSSHFFGYPCSSAVKAFSSCICWEGSKTVNQIFYPVPMKPAVARMTDAQAGWPTELCKCFLLYAIRIGSFILRRLRGTGGFRKSPEKLK